MKLRGRSAVAVVDSARRSGRTARRNVPTARHNARSAVEGAEASAVRSVQVEAAVVAVRRATPAVEEAAAIAAAGDIADKSFFLRVRRFLPIGPVPIQRGPGPFFNPQAKFT